MSRADASGSGLPSALPIHIDQAHLYGAEGAREFTIAGIALVAEPRLFLAPVDVFFGLPNVDASAAEAKRPKPHRIKAQLPAKKPSGRPTKSCCRTSV